MTEGKALALTDGDKGLAALALDIGGWSMEKALEVQGSTAGALEVINRRMVPMKEVEPEGVVYDEAADRFRFQGERSKILADGLRPIGIKISGRMSSGEANAWLAAMLLALSDLPFVVLRRGIEDAVHVPMKFLNEVETVVREKAQGAIAQHRAAKWRLELLQRQIDAANEPKLPAPEPMIWTQEKVDEANAIFKAAGARMRYRLDENSPEGISVYQAGEGEKES